MKIKSHLISLLIFISLIMNIVFAVSFTEFAAGDDCGQFNNPSDCSSGGDCIWDGAECFYYCDDCECAMHNNQDDCEQHENEEDECFTCRWENGYCHDGASDDFGPPACWSDCPDVDTLFAFFNDGEGDLTPTEICTSFASWGTSSCLNDCVDDCDINEGMMMVNICTECLANNNCEEMFAGGEDGDECGACHGECGDSNDCVVCILCFDECGGDENCQANNNNCVDCDNFGDDECGQCHDNCDDNFCGGGGDHDDGDDRDARHQCAQPCP